MIALTVSPKFQIVIPKAIREALHVRPGQKVQVLVYNGRIELIPLRSARELRGTMRGLDTAVVREEDRV